MSSEKEIVIGAIEKISETTELFYQQKEREGYQAMQGTIDVIAKVMETLVGYKVSHSEFPLDEQQILQSLTEAMQAMESKDTILLSDILEYDFVECLQSLAELME